MQLTQKQAVKEEEKDKLYGRNKQKTNSKMYNTKSTIFKNALNLTSLNNSLKSQRFSDLNIKMYKVHNTVIFSSSKINLQIRQNVKQNLCSFLTEINKLIIKLIWKHKNLVSTATLIKQNKVEGLILATVINRVYYWHQYGQISGTA